MAKSKRKMKYQIKPEWLGKIRLQTGEETFLLDEKTPQEVLQKLHTSSVLAGLYIEQVAATAPQTN